MQDAINLENCTYDVGLTADESYAGTAAELTAPSTRLEVTEPVTIDAPTEAIAAFPVEIQVRGPAVATHWVLFAPAGSAVEGQPGNPYSRISLKGGDQDVTLRAPFLPGDYELRYLPSRGEKQILISKPFHSVAPGVSIEAVATAKAGSPLDVHLTGDLAPGTAVTVVPAGSPDNAGGASATVNGGADLTLRIRKLPAEPGQYEDPLRHRTRGGRQVYARKQLIIQ